MRDRDPDVKSVCHTCSKEAQPDPNWSSAVWTVYVSRCSYCGGKIDLRLVDKLRARECDG